MTRRILIALLWLTCLPAQSAKGEEMKNDMTYTLRPIGTVKKHHGKTTLAIGEAFRPALLGLDGFSHVIVFYWFDKNDTPKKRSILQVHPRGNAANPLTGVFATRSPVRPNLIAMTVCKILSVEGRTVEVDKIDAFAESPILDLKPYIPRIDCVSDAKTPKWVGK